MLNGETRASLDMEQGKLQTVPASASERARTEEGGREAREEGGKEAREEGPRGGGEVATCNTSLHGASDRRRSLHVGVDQGMEERVPLRTERHKEMHILPGNLNARTLLRPSPALRHRHVRYRRVGMLGVGKRSVEG